MKFLSRKQVIALVLYSRAHLDRLSKAGLFPQPVRLGQGRVGYVDDEVYAWMNQRIAERDGHTGS